MYVDGVLASQKTIYGLFGSVLKTIYERTAFSLAAWRIRGEDPDLSELWKLTAFLRRRARATRVCIMATTRLDARGCRSSTARIAPAGHWVLLVVRGVGTAVGAGRGSHVPVGGGAVAGGARWGEVALRAVALQPPIWAAFLHDVRRVGVLLGVPYETFPVTPMWTPGRMKPVWDKWRV